jgi:hypothetical protein
MVQVRNQMMPRADGLLLDSSVILYGIRCVPGFER